jgi:phenol 2-monooxygenase
VLTLRLKTARIEEYLLQYIGHHSEISIEYGKMPKALSIDLDVIDERETYPVSVTVQHLPAELNKEEKGTHAPNGMFRSNLTTENVTTNVGAAKMDDGSHTETIQAKYVVGCDGAHSWTRRQIGSVMEGEHTDFIWYRTSTAYIRGSH